MWEHTQLSVSPTPGAPVHRMSLGCSALCWGRWRTCLYTPAWQLDPEVPVAFYFQQRICTMVSSCWPPHLNCSQTPCSSDHLSVHWTTRELQAPLMERNQTAFVNHIFIQIGRLLLNRHTINLHDEGMAFANLVQKGWPHTTPKCCFTCGWV